MASPCNHRAGGGRGGWRGWVRAGPWDSLTRQANTNHWAPDTRKKTCLKDWSKWFLRKKNYMKVTSNLHTQIVSLFSSNKKQFAPIIKPWRLRPYNVSNIQDLFKFVRLRQIIYIPILQQMTKLQASLELRKARCVYKPLFLYSPLLLETGLLHRSFSDYDSNNH